MRRYRGLSVFAGTGFLRDDPIVEAGSRAGVLRGVLTMLIAAVPFGVVADAVLSTLVLLAV